MYTKPYYQVSYIRMKVVNINHNNYNSLKCDSDINCCILHLLIHKVVNGQCNRTVDCNRTPPLK